MGVFLVLAIAVAIIVVIAIVRGTAPKDYVDAGGRPRCGKCKKIVYRNGSSAEGVAYTCAHTTNADAATGT